MNVHVLGSDYSQEMMGTENWWEAWGETLVKEVVAPIGAAIVGKRLSPTQKSVIQQVTGTSTSMPLPPPKKTFMEENGMYIMIGGAILVGAIILMKTRRSTGSRTV